MEPNTMPDYTYRAIHLGCYNWAVRRFGPMGCEETVFTHREDLDPQLRSTDRKIIHVAKTTNREWRKI
jgi:hypothetical protein